MTLNESIELVSISLNEYIETKFKKEKNNVSETLASAMKYSLKAGGKRIRPVLAFASLTVLKKQNLSIILPLMLALEMLHTYSLIHDDLPAMDDDDLRRGKPSNHKIYGEAVAILAGDALLTEVFTELSKLKKNFKAENVIDAISYFVNCAGMKGMVDGQVLDIANDSSKKIDNRKTLDEIYLKKTGALIRASVTIPAILLGEDIEPFEIYGNKIGQAFQIIDDIIGVTSTTKELGKTANIDEENNKINYVKLFGIQKSKEIALDIVSEGNSAILEKYGKQNTGLLLEISNMVLNRIN